MRNIVLLVGRGTRKRESLLTRKVTPLVSAALLFGTIAAAAPSVVAPDTAAAQITLVAPAGAGGGSLIREPATSRDFVRVPLVPDLSSAGVRYVKTATKARALPDADASSAGKLARGAKVTITANTLDGWRMIVRDGKGVWVRADSLVRSRPAPLISTATCASGSGMERGLTSDAVAVHRALCARYPQVTSFGGNRADADSFHNSGRAVDAMISDRATGWAMARWLRANASRLGVSEVIYAQRIWTVQRGGEGWRPMSNRGSVSANHFDHVHISVYGSAAKG